MAAPTPCLPLHHPGQASPVPFLRPGVRWTPLKKGEPVSLPGTEGSPAPALLETGCLATARTACLRLWAGPVISQELALPPRPLPEGWVGFPVYLLCNSCVFNRESLLLASPRGRTALQLPLLNTRLPCAVAAGLCEDKIRRGPRPCAVGGHRRGAGLGWAWTTSGTGLPWATACEALGVGRPGMSISAPGAPGRHRLPSAGNPGFCPCQEEGNEEGEQDRGKANEEKPGRRRQRNYGPKD